METLPDREPSLSLPRRGGPHYECDGISIDIHPPGEREYYFISPKESIGFLVGRKPISVVRALDSDVVKAEYVMPDTMGFVLQGSRVYARVCENQEDSGELLIMNYDPSLRQAIEQEMPNRKIVLRSDCNVPITPAMKILFQSILRFATNGFEGGKLVAQSLITLAIVRMLETFDKSSKRNTTSSMLKNRTLGRTLEFIEANLDRNIGLREIGDVAAVSLCHFSHCFKNAVGEPPYAYLTRRRVERAKDMLANTDIPLSEVALTCGFSSHSHLSTTFKRTTGLTPSRYRFEARR